MGRLELDVYVPGISLGIEFNGNYWHDERRDPEIKTRHDEKTSRCEREGVRLAVIWEDDWYAHREKIKKEIVSLLQGGDVPKWLTYDARRNDEYSLTYFLSEGCSTDVM